MSEPARRRGGGTGSPRSTARLAAVQALYQAEMTGTDAPILIAEFVKHRLGRPIDGDDYGKADEGLFRAVLAGTLGRQEELDRLIAGALDPEWSLDRLEMVLRALLRAAAFELVGQIEVPGRVIISEYVDIAHAFFAGKEPGLINGVLDRLGRQLRPGEWP